MSEPNRYYNVSDALLANVLRHTLDEADQHLRTISKAIEQRKAAIRYARSLQAEIKRRTALTQN